MNTYLYLPATVLALGLLASNQAELPAAGLATPIYRSSEDIYQPGAWACTGVPLPLQELTD